MTAMPAACPGTVPQWPRRLDLAQERLDSDGLPSAIRVPQGVGRDHLTPPRPPVMTYHDPRQPTPAAEYERLRAAAYAAHSAALETAGPGFFLCNMCVCGQSTGSLASPQCEELAGKRPV